MEYRKKKNYHNGMEKAANDSFPVTMDQNIALREALEHDIAFLKTIGQKDYSLIVATKSYTLDDDIPEILSDYMERRDEISFRSPIVVRDLQCSEVYFFIGITNFFANRYTGKKRKSRISGKDPSEFGNNFIDLQFKFPGTRPRDDAQSLHGKVQLKDGIIEEEAGKQKLPRKTDNLAGVKLMKSTSKEGNNLNDNKKGFGLFRGQKYKK